MRETEYHTYKNNNGEIIIKALVSPYGFRPEGNQEDWMKYAKEQKEKYNWDIVELFRESEDKQTGYTSTYFVCDIT